MHKYKTAKKIKGGGGIGGGNCYFDGEAMALGGYLAMKPLLRTLTPLLLMLGLTSLAFVVLSATRTHAAETATASVTVPVSCTITATPSNGGNATMNGGTYNAAAVETTLSAACNDNGGYSVYAIGYSGDASGDSNSTSMIGPSVGGTPLLIPSCTGDNCASTAPDSSRWAMKLTSISGTSTPTILGGYDGFSSIPLESTKVITYPSSTSIGDRSETKATYAVAISSAQPSGTYTGKVKYTIVHPNYANADGTLPTMQDATSSSLAELMPNTGDSTTLVDSRDGKSYTVAKLADGKYWMTSNLDLAGGTALSPADTDVTTTYINGFTSGNGLTKSGNTIVLPSSSSSFSTSDNNLAVVYNSGRTECTSPGCYSYYSFPAATLGAKRSNGSTKETRIGYNTAASICPKGWRLPTATTSNAQAHTNNNWKTGDFYALATAYGANLESNYYENTSTFYNNAGPGTTPNFLLSGRYDGTSFRNGGSSGYYWSSTSNAGSVTSAYDLSFSSDGVYSTNFYDPRYGFAVRCVFQPTMQDATASSLTELMPNTGDSTTLVDSRDGKSYTVAKLADGKYWMTTNLDLAGGTALSASDTDVTTDYINGFTGGNGLTKSGDTIVLPSSSNSFSDSDNNLAVVYNTGRTTCSSDSTTGSCYSYYSFPAATLGAKDSSGSTTVTGDGYNTAASICPKGWRLPTATTSNASAQTSPNWKTGDFYALATAYGANLESNYYENAGTFYNNAGPNTTPNFLLSGDYNGTSFYGGGSYGYYWSSTSSSGTSAYYLLFSSGRVRSAGSNGRRLGFAVRCLYDGQ